MTNIITHCDNCGCDWLDNGLNPVGCPYCKQRDVRIESESNYPIKYYKQGPVIYAVHGTSSINCVERLLAKIETLQAENEHLREALKDIRSCSLIDLIMQSNPVELTTRLGDIHQIANTALVKENRND